MTCDKCLHWKEVEFRNGGVCSSMVVLLMCLGDRPPADRIGLSPEQLMFDGVARQIAEREILTGPRFGCVHFTPKDDESARD